MSIVKLVENALDTLFVTFKELQESIQIVTHGKNPDWNTTTGILDQEYSGLNVNAIFISYNVRELADGFIERGDIKSMLRSKDITIPVNTGDLIIRANRSVWRVVNFTLDPTSTLYIAQVRRQDG